MADEIAKGCCVNCGIVRTLSFREGILRWIHCNNCGSKMFEFFGRKDSAKFKDGDCVFKKHLRPEAQRIMELITFERDKTEVPHSSQG